MSPQNLVRLGPFTLRADDDADVIRALEASGNKVGMIRACIRLAMAASGVQLSNPVQVQPRRTGDLVNPRGHVAVRLDESMLDTAEWAIIERAREAK